jgi:DNA repair photolyase
VEAAMAKVLRVLRPFDPWRNPLCTCPPKYSLNPYTGCSFMCLYCYATSYIGRRPSTPKKRFIENLVHDLNIVSPSILVNIGTSSDPYPPEEMRYRLTRKSLELMLPRGIRILITTKGIIPPEDIELIKKGNVAVTPTITTLDPRVASVIEPNAPPPSERIELVRALSKNSIPVGVRVDPIIPFVNDDPHEIEELVCRLASAGARFIVTSTYKAKPDSLSRLRRALGDTGERIYKLYREKGVQLYGYRYLPRPLREKILKPVVNAARKCGLRYATCREGLTSKEWFNAPSCDGSHLIPLRVKPQRFRGGIDIRRWVSEA